MRNSLKLLLCAGVAVLAFYSGKALSVSSCQIPAQCQNATCANESSASCTYTSPGSGMLCVPTGLPGDRTCHVPDINKTVYCSGEHNGQFCSGYFGICDGPCP